MEKLTHRLFLAVSAASLAPELAPWMKKLREGADRKELFVKWIPSEILHITVAFMGEMTDPQRAIVESVAEKVCSEVSPMRLKIEGFSAFPDLKTGRVLWCGVQNSKHLRGMRDRLATGFKDQGLTIEAEYQPHLMIGRLRNPKSVSDLLSPFVRTRLGKLEVDKIVLFESFTAGPFPTYKILREFPLTGLKKQDDEG